MASEVYNVGGSWARWSVPKGVEYVNIELDGASSGSRRGSRVIGRLVVKDTWVLYIGLGEHGQEPQGTSGGKRTFGGGARGGSGSSGLSGGYSGGGGSVIRLNSTTGRVLVAAGGAGGDSGDGGPGGLGGNDTGDFGAPGTAGAGTVGNATGGTQIQGGNGGTSSVSADLAGENAENTVFVRAGHGGDATSTIAGHGGGGGGGGYRAGGGGQASANGRTPGGGGGGGSNYTENLTRVEEEQGGGRSGDGRLELLWTGPGAGNNPPSPPGKVKIEGMEEAEALATKSRGTVRITAKIDDPNKGQRVRIMARWSTSTSFNRATDVYSPRVDQGERAEVRLTGLQQDTHYYARLYTQDEDGRYSESYNYVDFWTNRSPNPPTLTFPLANSQISNLLSVAFRWDFSDPDPRDTQTAFRLRWRRQGTPLEVAGEWSTHERVTSFEEYVTDPGTFKANTFYEWQVKTRDPQEKWGDWSLLRSLYVTGATTPPLLRFPHNGDAVIESEPTTFRWLFQDPHPGQWQTVADIRWRVLGHPDWTTVSNASTNDEFYEAPAETFPAGVKWEWQVRTKDSTGEVGVALYSDWSESRTFWSVPTPGSQALDLTVVDESNPLTRLGCGDNRVFIYDRCGKVLRGEITPLANVEWERRRDDISSCRVTVNQMPDDGGALLGSIHTWRHEVVVFRDGERVWEGPIVRIADRSTGLEIEAKDVMQYVYRRILRNGYNDAYQLSNGQQLGIRAVTSRAALIAINALAPDDPNVLPYLTTIENRDDAVQSRVVERYSRTAWEEIDDLAATAGLDYTTVGRRIIFNDTHRALGRLPEMRNGDFSDPPIITEYGMLFATHYAVTNGSGAWGEATPEAMTEMGPEGLIEMLSSAYGEAEGGTADVLTPEAREALVRSMASQARRNIASRYPVPQIVRVPDNSALNPDIAVDINQLIPGVWMPLRAEGLVRSVSQWQKLDSITVSQDSNGERVRAVLSPAPNGGLDPDADLDTEAV